MPPPSFTPVWFEKDGERTLARTREQADSLIEEGYQLRTAVQDIDAYGRRQVRPLNEQERRLESSGAASVGSQIAVGEDVADLLEQQRQDEITRAVANRPGEQIAAAAAQGLGVATLGASTALGFDPLQDPNLSQREQGIFQEEQGGARALGSVVGAVTPWGAEGVAARWLSQAVRGGSTLARVGSVAAEGAVGGLAEGLVDVQLNDTGSVSERLMASAGLGALAGGVIGGVGAGVGRMFRRGLVRETLEEVEQGALGVEQRALSNTAEDGVQFAMEDFVAGPMGPVERALLQARENISGTPIGSARHGVDIRRMPVQEAFDQINREGAGVYFGRVAREMAQGTDAARSLRRQLQSPLSSPVVSDMLERVGGEVTTHVRGAAEGLANTLRHFAETNGAHANILRNLAGEFSQAEGLTARELLANLTSAREVFVSTARGADSSLADILNPLEKQIDDLLEGSHWGEELSPLLSNRLRSYRGLDAFLRRVEPIFDTKGAKVELSGENLARYVKSALEGNNDTELSALRNYLSYADEALRQADVLGVTAERGAREALESARQAIDSGIAGYKAFDAVQIAQKGEQASSGLALALQGGAGIIGGGIGMAMAGPMGAALGVGLAGAGNLAMTYMRKAVGFSRLKYGMSKLFRTQERRLAQATSTVTTNMASPSRSPFGTRVAPAAGTVAAILVNGSREEKIEAYRTLSARIEELSSNPEALARAASESGSATGYLDPNLPQAMGMGAVRQVTALSRALSRGRMPRGVANMLAPLAPPSTVELDEFLTVAAVVDDPLFSVDLMNSGGLTDAAARAVSEAYPAFHTEVSAMLMSQMGERVRGGQSVNYQTALQVSRFVGHPLDQTMEPGFTLAMQDQSAQTPQQERAQFVSSPSTRRMSVGNDAMTASQRIEQ